ncbi:MAG: tRNA threonylcarbamoyladenosine dehydratase [Clostridia bacterium]|nr:tRNA threonylcarbamoyladenosine dehydratase [Clostridia bacterium]
MHEQFSRTALLLGEEAIEKLSRCRVAVFGVGGVGGYAVEALARCGVGALDLIDNDTVAPSNLNRQIIALHSSIGRSKVDVAAERAQDINPNITVYRRNCFFLPETADSFDFSQYDYVVDAIDTVSGKVEIILRARAAGVPVISSMGAGNKLDPTRFRVADIYETKVCPLARAMRGLLRKKGVDRLKVVYSEEEAIKTEAGRLPGSVAFVPSVAGLILAGEVIKDLIKEA